MSIWAAQGLSSDSAALVGADWADCSEKPEWKQPLLGDAVLVIGDDPTLSAGSRQESGTAEGANGAPLYLAAQEWCAMSARTVCNGSTAASALAPPDITASSQPDLLRKISMNKHIAPGLRSMATRLAAWPLCNANSRRCGLPTFARLWRQHSIASWLSSAPEHLCAHTCSEAWLGRLNSICHA